VVVADRARAFVFADRVRSAAALRRLKDIAALRHSELRRGTCFCLTVVGFEARSSRKQIPFSALPRKFRRSLSVQDSTPSTLSQLLQNTKNTHFQKSPFPENLDFHRLSRTSYSEIKVLISHAESITSTDRLLARGRLARTPKPFSHENSRSKTFQGVPIENRNALNIFAPSFGIVYFTSFIVSSNAKCSIVPSKVC
jgi:hypothetical protein